MLDQPSFHATERITCSIAAAAKYDIPANVVLAIAEKENGHPGQWVRNTNGTHDVGPLQFNTRYLATLARHGITTEDVAASGCYSYDLAAWRLRQHIFNDTGDFWQRLSNYHSRTTRFNRIYRADLMRRAARWADWLAARYPTHEVPRSEKTGVPLRIPDTQTLMTASPKASTTAAPAQSPSYVPRQLILSNPAFVPDALSYRANDKIVNRPL